jgi:hypothetical protein
LRKCYSDKSSEVEVLLDPRAVGDVDLGTVTLGSGDGQDE